MKGRGIKPPIEKIIIRGCLPRTMVKGLKETSGLITIGFSVEETAANTFTEAQVDLQLNILDREVMIVYGIDMDPSPPDALAGLNTVCDSSLSTTSRTTVGNLNDTNVLAVGERFIRAAGFVDGGVAFETMSSSSPATQLPYIGIISTNDFFVQVQGNNNANPMSVRGKLYCARATATADVYSALTQSELLSA